MDPLIAREYIEFNVDEVTPINKDTFILRVIPNIDSEFFPSFHLRYIRISYRLLEKSLYKSFFHGIDRSDFKGTVLQGGYYRIPTEDVRRIDLFNVDETTITIDNDVFEGNIQESPFDEQYISGDNSYSGKQVYEYLQETKVTLENTYLYCFNVGQGDSMLLITTSGNAYLIDSNCYGKKVADTFTKEIKIILRSHNISNLKGLIVTHKHIDHIRGLRYIIDSKQLNIENFIINHDYLHPTKAVFELMNSARSISSWHNINTQGIIQEGNTKLCFLNPDASTANKGVAPDINNSSIGLCIRQENTVAYLTGDLGSRIINSKFNCSGVSNKRDSILKVSHHGSHTGTDDHMLKLLNPSHAFISAGTSKNYNHPHTSVIRLLRNHNINLRISKIEKRTVCYKFGLNKIIEV